MRIECECGLARPDQVDEVADSGLDGIDRRLDVAEGLAVLVDRLHEQDLLALEAADLALGDLSAPDPSSIMNLFGLLPWGTADPTSFLAIFSIGVYPILMGITMWLQQKLNPMPTDPTQAMIFAWMPWVFMFMLGQFAVGLVIYWVTNNTITFMQQYIIMRSQGVKVDLLGNITIVAPGTGATIDANDLDADIRGLT